MKLLSLEFINVISLLLLIILEYVTTSIVNNAVCYYDDCPELIEGNCYEGRQTSKGELFVKVFGMSRDCEGAHIDFKMVASV